MCDYSLQNVKSRPAKIGDKLTARNFGTGTVGFAASEDASLAVCFYRERSCRLQTWFSVTRDIFCVGKIRRMNHQTAIFRQINKEKTTTHHDALEFPDGHMVLLTRLREGQQATVLQLPAAPKTAAEFVAQQRIAYVG